MIPVLPLGHTWGGGALPAALIGTAFGAALERAGLGSPRKLAGQFYGYDLTVLKVMLTAILTAMIGLQLLSLAGVLDLGRVYLPPTFLLPQVIGGLLFGVGFVVGGYCPGTCFVGAVGGRFDAVFALLGMVAGMLVYGAALPLFRAFADSTALGAVTVPELLRVRTGWLVFFLVAGSLVLFSAINRWERSRA